MKIDTLIHVVETRIAAEENNYTARSFLWEILKVLEDYKRLTNELQK